MGRIGTVSWPRMGVDFACVTCQLVIYVALSATHLTFVNAVSATEPDMVDIR